MSTVPQIGQNILYASQNGCVPDCVVTTGAKVGGGTPTDNTTALNALLALASTFSNGARVILDGGFAHKGLLISSNVSLEGVGPSAGLFLLAGANTHCITNWTSYSQSATVNISVKNLYLNGNRNNQTLSPFSQTGIFIFSCTQVRIEKVTLVNIGQFNVCVESCTDVQGVECNITSNWVYGDGFHVSGGVGGSSNLKFSRNTIATVDDGIALNAPEHGGAGGPISDVEVCDNVYIGAVSMVRMYSSATNSAAVSRVMVANNSGTFTGQTWATGCVFFLGNGDTYADGIRDFSAVNITASLTDSSGHFMKISDSCGTVKVTGTWDSPIAANSFVILQTAAVTVSNLDLSDCTIYRSTRGSSLAYGVQSTIAGATIGRLRISGFNVVNESGQTYSAIPYLIDMANLTITELVIDALDTKLITALVNPTTGFTGIGSISGAGVLATGINIPDSVMANGTPYLSATSPNVGMPCIKIAGTVYPFTI